MHTNYVLYKTYYWVHCWASESKRNLQALVLSLKGKKDKTHEHDLCANMEGNIFFKANANIFEIVVINTSGCIIKAEDFFLF